MKKFMSLVLALVLAVSLVTVGSAGAGAAAFTDDSSIQYKEAVDVIAALEIMGGYADGRFGPSGFLTRGAATKIICNLMLTPATANTITAGADTFPDVPATSSYSGFIAYCVRNNIVSGYADGTFHPYANLSGNAFLKMLLGALGYKQDIEGYSGAGWSNNVRIRAQQIGLIDSTFTSGDVTRETAALLALRALEADEVQYDTSTIINGRNAATPRSAGSGITERIKSDGILQLAEDNFNRLEKKSGAAAADAFGRPASTWSWNGSEIGAYLKTADKVYYDDVTSGEIFNDLGMTTNSSSLTFYVNGVSRGTAGISIARNSSTKLSAMTASADNIIGNGTEVQVFRDSDDNSVVISAIAQYGGKVGSIRTASSSRSRAVVLDAAADTAKRPAGFGSSTNAFETADFSVDDVVAYTFSEKTSSIESVKLLTAVENSLTRYRAGNSITLGSATYPYARMIAFQGDLTGEGSLAGGSNYRVYLLSSNGENYALWVENVAATVDGYALVLGSENKGSLTDARARLLFSNGSVSIVNLNDNFTGGDNVIVRYTIKDGQYVLTPISAENRSYITDSTVRVGNSTVSLGATSAGRNISADANTVFVVQVGGVYRVYTGIRNVPNITGTAAYTFHENGVARVVFITSAETSTTSSDLIFIAANSDTASGLVYEEDYTYREYDAVVNGRVTTIRVSAKPAVTLNGKPNALTVQESGQANGAQDSVIINRTTANADGIVTSGSFTSSSIVVARARGLRFGSGTVNLGTFPASSESTITDSSDRRNEAIVLSNDLNIYTVDADGVIAAYTGRESNLDDNDDWVFYTAEDNQVTNLFVLSSEYDAAAEAPST